MYPRDLRSNMARATLATYHSLSRPGPLSPGPTTELKHISSEASRIFSYYLHAKPPNSLVSDFSHICTMPCLEEDAVKDFMRSTLWLLLRTLQRRRQRYGYPKYFI